MKLVSLYIENFGGLSQYALQFHDGVTVICEPNGFGKTTLAEFIRAMFYGFPRKAKTLDKSRRQKYAPWNGGKYGGNLVFQLEQEQFRIERTFGATPRGDSFTLIDLSNNRKSSRFTEDIGLELFQLDAESFERSTYMPQLRADFSLTTDSIRAKLTNLVEDTNDVGNFDKAMTALRTKRSTFIPYRGSGGSVAQASSRVSTLQDELDRLQHQKHALEEGSGQIAQMQRQCGEDENRRLKVRDRILQASQAAAAATVQLQYTQMLSKDEQLQQRSDALRPHVLEPDRLQELTEMSRELSRKRHEQEMLSRSADDAALEQLAMMFPSGTPTQEELFAHQQNLVRIHSLQQENIQLAAMQPEQTQRKKDSPAARMVFALLMVAGFAAGIVFLLKKLYLIGIISLGIGLAGLVGAVFAGVRAMVGRELAAAPAMHPQQLRIRKNEEQIGLLQQIVREFVQPYSAARDLEEALRQLQRSTSDYHDLLRKRAARQEAMQVLDTQAAKLETQLRRQLGEGDFDQKILQRQMAREQFLQIQEARKTLAQEKQAFERAHGDILRREVSGENGDLAQLKQEEALLTSRLDALTRQLLQLRHQHQQMQAQCERIPAIRDELEQWQEKKRTDQKKAQLLDNTMEILEKAKENLANSYLASIRSSFGSHLERLTRERQEQILMTPDLEVQLERYGEARDLAYFSAGQTDAVMLCMRLALVDALFTGVKPFIILDDPFVNLDDERTAQALDMLKELAKDRQIIYLVCNSSRTM